MTANNVMAFKRYLEHQISFNCAPGGSPARMDPMYERGRRAAFQAAKRQLEQMLEEDGLAIDANCGT